MVAAAFLDRCQNAFRLWFSSVDPFNEIFWAAFRNDAMNHGLLPHPLLILHDATGRMMSDCISSIVVGLIVAPSDFPYSWRDPSSSFSSSSLEEADYNRGSSSTKRRISALHHFRTLATFSHLSGHSIVRHLFGQLYTTRLARKISASCSGFAHRWLIGPICKPFNAIFDFFFPHHGRFLANNNNGGTTFAGSIMKEEHEQFVMMTVEEYERHCYDVFSSAVEKDGPLRAMLYRNAVPMLTFFLREQLLWGAMTGMSLSKRIRKCLTGAPFHFFSRRSLMPYRQVWRLHLVSTCCDLWDVGSALICRGAGAFIGFNLIFKARLAAGYKESSPSPLPSSGRSSYYTHSLLSFVSLCDACLYGEQLFAFLSRPYRRFVRHIVADVANHALYKLAPLEMSEADAQVEEDWKQEEEEEYNRQRQQQQQQQQKSGAAGGAEAAAESSAAAAPAGDIPEADFESARRNEVFTKEDFYDLLGVPKRATSDEIKKAHRTLSLNFHPDRVMHLPDAAERTAATEKFKMVQKAYEVLRDERLRAQYDAAQAAGLHDAADTSSGSPGRRGAGGQHHEESIFYDEREAIAVAMGTHPAQVASRYLHAVDSIQDPTLRTGALLASSVAATGLGFCAVHCHMAAAFSEAMSPGCN